MTKKNNRKGGLIHWDLETVRARCDIDGDCWIWTMGCTGMGVPQARINGKCQAVPRFVMGEIRRQQCRRSINAGDVVRPVCGNPLCVSPECLYLDTRSRVVRDLHASQAGKIIRQKARKTLVENGHIKINEQIADLIREARGEISATALASAYSISPDHVRAIWAGRMWKPVIPANSVFAWAGAA